MRPTNFQLAAGAFYVAHSEKLLQHTLNKGCTFSSERFHGVLSVVLKCVALFVSLKKKPCGISISVVKLVLFLQRATVKIKKRYQNQSSSV